MRYSKRKIISIFLIFILIPFTIYIGFSLLKDRKYYFISTLILTYTILSFTLAFENRNPKPKELIMIATISAIGVAGRNLTSMIKPFTPIDAVTIISGVSLGPEIGFLIGTMIMFVSNFFFGQGPWTPWQMVALGTVGFISGMFYKKGLVKKNKKSLCIFGGFATFFIYGGIMNPAALIMWESHVSLKLIVAYYISGITYDLVHASGTVFFLYFISEPMFEKIQRIKIKYGLFENINGVDNIEKKK